MATEKAGTSKNPEELPKGRRPRDRLKLHFQPRQPRILSGDPNCKCRPVRLSLAIINPFARMIARRDERVMFKTPASETAERRRTWTEHNEQFETPVVDRDEFKRSTRRTGHRGAIVPPLDVPAVDATADDGRQPQMPVKFVSTKESAKVSWPISYTQYRDSVADVFALKQPLKQYQELTLLRHEHGQMESSLGLSFTASSGEGLDDAIGRSFEALCRHVSECREAARAAVRRKRLALDRLTRERVRDLQRISSSEEMIGASMARALLEQDERLRELRLEMLLVRQLRWQSRCAFYDQLGRQRESDNKLMMTAQRRLFRAAASSDAESGLSRMPVFPADLRQHAVTQHTLELVRRCLSQKLVQVQQVVERNQPARSRLTGTVQDWNAGMSALRELLLEISVDCE